MLQAFREAEDGAQIRLGGFRSVRVLDRHSPQMGVSSHPHHFLGDLAGRQHAIDAAQANRCMRHAVEMRRRLILREGNATCALDRL